jgi:hypothetical protein
MALVATTTEQRPYAAVGLQSKVQTPCLTASATHNYLTTVCIFTRCSFMFICSFTNVNFLFIKYEEGGPIPTQSYVTTLPLKIIKILSGPH